MERLNLFGYPVGFYQIADEPSLDALVHEIVAEEGRSKGVQISNRGGWQSSKSYFERETPAFSRVKQQLFDAFEDFLVHVYGTAFPRSSFKLEAWANVNYQGHHNASHDHTAQDNHWSGILYLQTGTNDASSSGVTVFENRHLSGDGRFVASMPIYGDVVGQQGSMFELVPEIGKLVFFPGTLWHHVKTYQGTKKRVTIAFNIRVNELSNFSFDGGSRKSRLFSYMWINFRGFMVLGSKIKHLLSAGTGREKLR